MEIKYRSIFKNDINNMILYEKTMKFKYIDRLSLLDLDNFFIFINKTEKIITEEDFKKYIYNFEKSNLDIPKRYLIISKFCKFLIRFGNTNIFYEEIYFDQKLLFEPHIYTQYEMKKILSIIDNKKYIKQQFYYEYPVLFRLLYSTGLRISEVLNITYDDVDLTDNSINIIESKNDISRKIYFSYSMKKVMIKYFKIMKFKKNQKIFTAKEVSILITFKSAVKATNITVTSIRLHDLRHSFAVMALDNMINKNIEPEEALIYLEKFMGHSSISSTEYYLHMTDKMKNEIIDTMDNYMPNLYPKVKDGVECE